ncbi:anti-sigma factor family protein [Syntrophomonas wolfei]|jgi:anti-sigma factor RsiW|uniref:anti-sigma factor family protein n=1 Tax=Syntrophomonas wolfei TaxID=863 RepID=UPI0023F08D5F|nr:zf-HC2 domain-containing protein [Syntrophomonas wolfei]
MQCNQENLQMYLDGEMDALTRKEMEEHLARCPSCRREMGRLQLLWLELGQNDEEKVPAELSYLRSQAVHQFLYGQPDDSNTALSYWEAQKLAWRPALLGASYFPGISLISAAGHQVPKLMSGAASVARRLLFPPRDNQGGAVK